VDPACPCLFKLAIPGRAIQQLRLHRQVASSFKFAQKQAIRPDCPGRCSASPSARAEHRLTQQGLTGIPGRAKGSESAERRQQQTQGACRFDLQPPPR